MYLCKWRKHGILCTWFLKLTLKYLIKSHSLNNLHKRIHRHTHGHTRQYDFFAMSFVVIIKSRINRHAHTYGVYKGRTLSILSGGFRGLADSNQGVKVCIECVTVLQVEEPANEWNREIMPPAYIAKQNTKENSSVWTKVVAAMVKFGTYLSTRWHSDDKKSGLCFQNYCCSFCGLLYLSV